MFWHVEGCAGVVGSAVGSRAAAASADSASGVG